MVAVEKNQPDTVQKANKPIREAQGLSKSKSAVLDPTTQFLAHGGSPDAFIIAKGSTKKED